MRQIIKQFKLVKSAVPYGYALEREGDRGVIISPLNWATRPAYVRYFAEWRDK